MFISDTIYQEVRTSSWLENDCLYFSPHSVVLEDSDFAEVAKLLVDTDIE